MTSSFGLDFNIEATDELTLYTFLPVIYKKKKKKTNNEVEIYWRRKDFLDLGKIYIKSKHF